MTQPTRPSQPFSMTIRLGGRKMTLTWRPRRALPAFLRTLLARSRRVLLGALGGSALSGAALAAGALPGGALPNFNALVAGQAQLSQNGNQLTIAQGSDRAILNWNSFNIGNQASVRFVQPGVDSVALNRVLSNDPSSLLGQLSANGKVWLINPAGILVGQGARIDVGGFVASTLPVRDEDFLAKRLSFGGAAAATGMVRNDGSITTPQGGSVYLIGGGVENAGLIHAPGGEVLLAAGQRVQLVDTGTPGVKIEITGADGAATNLGQIASSAGRIGLAAGLVKNAGTLDASSVVERGGRIFLKASGTLSTEASSRIAADGTSGGSVTLYADDAARLAGAISATGSAGAGGFVETSGKRVLSLAHAPTVGAGGTWLIDPDNITIQSTGSNTNVGIYPDGDIYIESSGGNAIVTTATIQKALNLGTSVNISTGYSSGDSTGAGDITVNGAITKSASGDAALSLNAYHNINLNAPISATAGTLNLNLNSSGGQSGGSINLASSINLHGGTLNLGGDAVLKGATLDGLIFPAPIETSYHVEFGTGTNTVNVPWDMNSAWISGGTLQGKGGLSISNLYWNGGTIKGAATNLPIEVSAATLMGNTVLDGRVLNLNGASSMTAGSLTMKNSATLNNHGMLSLADGARLGVDVNGLASSAAGTSVINNYGLIDSSSNGAANVIGGSYSATSGVAFNNTGSGEVRVSLGPLTLGGDGKHSGSFVVGNGSGDSTLRFGSDRSSTNGSVVNLNPGVSFYQANGTYNARIELGDSAYPTAGTVNLNTPLGQANLPNGSNLTVLGGVANLNNDLAVDFLNLAGGQIKGSANLTVLKGLEQSGGTIALSGTNSTVDITQALGNLSVGNIAAANVKLAAADLSSSLTGAISQTGAIKAASLTTSSIHGTVLENSGNRLTAFSAVNSASGDGAISLLNTSKPGLLTLGVVDNPVGSIKIDNTGGVVVAQPISANGTIGTSGTSGTVLLRSHSPITVDSIISASGDITLESLKSSAGNDAITINGSLLSGANIAVTAGSSVVLGADSSMSGTSVLLKASSGTITGPLTNVSPNTGPNFTMIAIAPVAPTPAPAPAPTEPTPTPDPVVTPTPDPVVTPTPDPVVTPPPVVIPPPTDPIVTPAPVVTPPPETTTTAPPSAPIIAVLTQSLSDTATLTRPPVFVTASLGTSVASPSASTASSDDSASGGGGHSGGSDGKTIAAPKDAPQKKSYCN